MVLNWIVLLQKHLASCWRGFFYMFSYNIFISLPGPYIRLLFQCMLSLESVFLFFFYFLFFNENPLLCRLERGSARYHDGYGRLRSWAYRSLDSYKVTCRLVTVLFSVHLWNCSFSVLWLLHIVCLFFFAAWAAACAFSTIYPLLHGSCGKRESSGRYEL